MEVLYKVSNMAGPLFITPDIKERLIGLALDGLAGGPLG